MFFNKEKKFDKKFNDHIKSMVEVSFEYVGWNEKEIDHIYIFGSTEESSFFTFFYSIKGNIVERHKVNDYLVQKCNIKPSQQTAADMIGLKDLIAIMELFEKYKKEVPTILKIRYDTHSTKVDTNLSYEKRLIGTELGPADLLSEWIESLT